MKVKVSAMGLTEADARRDVGACLVETSYPSQTQRTAAGRKFKLVERINLGATNRFIFLSPDVTPEQAKRFE